MKQIAIVHYNTPELTEACILSIRKVGCDWPVTVLDNSDKRPFTKRMKCVKVLNNRKQQLVNFDEELAKYPDKCWDMAKKSNYGSVKHMMSVQYLWGVLPDGFILVESDVLIKADITKMWREEYSFTAYVQRQQRGNKFGMGRILPMLCYLNVPKFKAEGVRYFDPDRSWMLHSDENDKRNWYDTGASLREDVLAHRPRLKGLHVDIRPMVEHLGGASYKTLKGQAEWLTQHRALWETESKPKTTKRTNSMK